LFLGLHVLELDLQRSNFSFDHRQCLLLGLELACVARLVAGLLLWDIQPLPCFCMDSVLIYF
jgi:hypothetical protein